MQRTLFLILAVCAATFVHGAWYWPFGSDEDDPSKPMRLHRLLEDANNYIEVAEDEALDGNAEKALENYRLALSELDRIERENPDRAETPEFSPLRNKRAACIAAMDAIRFAQVNDNERAVSVTDTRELQKKWNKKHGIKEPEEPKKVEEKPAEEKPAVKEAQPVVKEEKPTEPEAQPAAKEKKPVVKEEPPAVKEEKPVVKEEPPVVKEEKPVVKEEPPAAKVEKQEKEPVAQEAKPAAADFNARFKIALAEVRNKDYAAADLMLEALLKERPDDLNTLLLRAAAQVGLESNYAARRTLEKAMRVHPKSYLPYYNLANLVLKLGEGVESARQYYEMGRMVGGPAMPKLEARLKK